MRKLSLALSLLFASSLAWASGGFNPGSGGGGGSSTLETLFGTARSSPTATLKGDANLTGSVTGSTMTIQLGPTISTVQTFTSSLTVNNIQGLSVTSTPSGTAVSTGIFNVNSTVDPSTWINNASVENNEANMASFRFAGPITGTNTQVVPLYCKLTNTGANVNALADGVCAYLWARDTAGKNGNIYGSNSRVTGQGSATLYEGGNFLAQWVATNGLTTGTTSQVYAAEFGVQITSANGSGISTGTVADIILDNKVGSGSSGTSWAFYSLDTDPSYFTGKIGIGTNAPGFGLDDQAASGANVKYGLNAGSLTVTGVTSLGVAGSSITLGSAGSTVGISSNTNLLGQVNFSSEVVLNGASGTNGQVLTSGGQGTVPTWTTIASGGGGYAMEPTTVTLQASQGVYIGTSSTNSSAFTITSSMTVVFASGTANAVTTYTLPVSSSVCKNGTAMPLSITKVDTTTGPVNITVYKPAGDLIMGTTGLMVLNAVGQTDEIISDCHGNWWPHGLGIQATPVKMFSMHSQHFAFQVAASSDIVYCPVYFPTPVSVTGYTYVSNTISGNAQVAFGITDNGGNVVCSTGPAVQVGGGSNGIVTSPACNLPPGGYYVATQVNNGTSLLQGEDNGNGSLMGCYQSSNGAITTMGIVSTKPGNSAVSTAPQVGVLLAGQNQTSF